MSEMVERCAMAMHKAGFFPNVIPWEKCAEAYREERRMFARAAIEAMREPTAEMVVAAWRSEGTSEIWQAMIEEALK